jgi:hypothetical protein
MAKKNYVDFLYENGDFGLEIEMQTVNREDYFFTQDFNKLFPNYDKGHDASCETPTYFLGKYPVYTDNPERIALFSGQDKKTIGGEIISPILSASSDQWKIDVENLLGLLFKYGESSDTSRDSLHVHVNVGKSISLASLKRLLKMTAAYEYVLYRLGGMGKKNRGEENSFIYQRPYLGNSPPVIQMAYNYPITSFDGLMEAESKEQFFGRLGDSTYYANNGTRYVTQRYFDVNFYSIPYYGSLEFRTANKTLNSSWAIAWINFCRGFVQKAISCPPDETEKVYRPLYANKELHASELIEILETFPILTQDDKLNLLSIWQASPHVEYDNIWRYSHLYQNERMKPTVFQTMAYAPESLSPKVKVLDAQVVDFHQLQRNLAAIPRKKPEIIVDLDFGQDDPEEFPFRVRGWKLSFNMRAHDVYSNWLKARIEGDVPIQISNLEDGKSYAIEFSNDVYVSITIIGRKVQVYFEFDGMDNTWEYKLPYTIDSLANLVTGLAANPEAFF